MTLVVVATTLVSDAASKIVSSVIASRAGTVARAPNRLADEDAIAMADDDDRARQLLGGDGVVDQRMDARGQRRVGAGLALTVSVERARRRPGQGDGEPEGPHQRGIIRARRRGRRSSRSAGSDT